MEVFIMGKFLGGVLTTLGVLLFGAWCVEKGENNAKEKYETKEPEEKTTEN